MIVAAGDEAIDLYYTFIKKIWLTKQWPLALDWKKSIYVTLLKKGDMQLCSNYRTIALISHASKILLNILIEKTCQKVREIS